MVAKLGIGYEDVKGRNPGVVYCSTSGYGQEGPRAQWAGHDLNYLAVTGFLAATQPRGDGGPPIPGATVADSAGGGMHAVIAVLAALVRRAATGEGAYLDVSVTDGVLALMALHVDEYLATGDTPHNVLTGRYACYDTYRTADDRWLAVAAIEPRFWANLCRLLELEQWTSHQTDDTVQDEIRADLAGPRSRRRRAMNGLPTRRRRHVRLTVLAIGEVPAPSSSDASRTRHVPAAGPDARGYGPMSSTVPDDVVS